MNLLLSNAYNLYWLGRYMQRTICLTERLRNDQQASLFPLMRHVGFQSAINQHNFNSYITSEVLPSYLSKVNDNFQAVRGVIDYEAFELFQLMNRLNQAGSLQSACYQLQACEAALRAHPAPISTYWMLGHALETLDERLRFGQTHENDFRALADAVTNLPNYTSWEALKQPAQALVYLASGQKFYQLTEQLENIFEDGL